MRMIELKTPTEIKKMHITGQFVAQVLAELQDLADVGVNLLDLEHHVRRRIDERGAESCYWDYAPSFGSGPFRNVICLSVNARSCTGCRTTTGCVTATSWAWISPWVSTAGWPTRRSRSSLAQLRRMTGDSSARPEWPSRPPSRPHSRG